MKTRILSVYNQKGGVGKSTVSVNVGAALALMLSHETPASGYPERVLVVDLDQQINSEVTLSGGFFGERNYKGLLGPWDNIAGLLMMQTDKSATEIIQTAGIPRGAKQNLDFIPSSKEKMLLVDPELQAHPEDGLFRLRELLESLASFYSYVIIDNPPGLSHRSISSLIAATHVVIPCQLEAGSIDGLTDAIRTIQGIQRRQNQGLELVGILPTMCDFRIQEQNEFYAQLQQEYRRLMLPPIYRRADVTVANSQGLDIFSFKPSRQSGGMVSSSPATQDFAQASEEIRRRMD